MSYLFDVVALVCLVGVGYSYAGYPLILWLAIKLGFGHKDATDSSNLAHSGASESRRVDVVIAAYNEEEGIADCVSALLNQATDSLDVHVYIGSDASEDATNQILLDIDSDRLHLFLFEQRRGKTAVLNDLLQEVEAPYLVFSDADIVFGQTTIADLVAELEQGNRACVCGHLNLLDPQSGQNLDGAYWLYERVVRQLEAQLNTLVSIPGAIFCIKKECVTALPDGCINDDLYQALSLLSQQQTTGYAKQAIATGYNASTLEAERGRRLRIGMGNYQAEKNFRRQLSSFTALSAFQYLSHKVLRWYSPHLLIVALAASAIGSLLGSTLSGFLLVAQLALYSYCALTKLLSGTIKLPGLLMLPLFFVEMNLAFLVAYHRYLEDDISHLWGTPRANVGKGAQA